MVIRDNLVKQKVSSRKLLELPRETSGLADLVTAMTFLEKQLSLVKEKISYVEQEMEKIIAFADTVSHAPVSDTGFDNIHHLENGFRPDVVTPSLPQEEILQNAEHQENGCFFVPNRK